MLTPGSTIIDTDDWGLACRYFVFYVSSHGAHVLVDIKGSGLDVTLKLHRGRGATSITETLGYNDDNLETRGSIDSRLGRHLQAGSHVIEARLKDPSQATASKVLTIQLQRWIHIPHDGRHQPDGTSAYSLHNMPSIATEVGRLFSRSISGAANAWNVAVGGFWPNQRVCLASDTLCDDRNSDDHVIPITVTNDAGACGNGSHACAKFGPRWPVLLGPPIHIRPTFDIEQPPTAHRRVFTWQDSDPDLHNVEFMGVLYAYMPGVMLHEFGHTLGLDDLPTLPSYLMGSSVKRNTVPSKDIQYMHQVVREHDH